MINPNIIRHILKWVYNVKKNLDTPVSYDTAKDYASRVAQEFKSPAIAKILLSEESRKELGEALHLFGLQLRGSNSTNFYIEDSRCSYMHIAYAFGALIELRVMVNVKNDEIKMIKGF